MNALTLIFAAACIFAIAYRFYGLYLAQKVMNLREDRVTPAEAINDGHDYVKTNKYVLFGHHFADHRRGRPAAWPGHRRAVRLHAGRALDSGRLRDGRRRP